MFARLTRSLAFCFFVATAVTLAPLAVARAQSPPAATGPRYFTPQTVGVAMLRPQAILTSPSGDYLPREIWSALLKKEVGIDFLQATRIAAVVEPPLGPQMFYSIVVRFAEPVDLSQLNPKALEHTEVGKLGEYDCFVSRDPQGPSFFQPDNKTLVIGSQPMLRKLFASKSSASASSTNKEFFERIVAHQNDDAYLALNFAAIRPLAQMALMTAGEQIPEEYRPYTELVNYLAAGELALNLNPGKPTTLNLFANSPEDAGKLVDLVNQARDLGREKMREQIPRLAASEDIIEQATAEYLTRIDKKEYPPFLPEPEGNQFSVFSVDNSGEGFYSQNPPLVVIAVVGILVALLLPAVQAAREAARRNQALNQMKQIMLSWHNYYDAKNEFPAQAISDADGKPLLSWRVAILPYIEEQALYEQFHLDEPWDSTHNMALIPQMPLIYADPSSQLDPNEGRSSFAGVTGEQMALTGDSDGRGFAEFTDGTSRSIIVVQVDDEHAPIWTQPADWSPNQANPYAGLGGLHPNVTITGYADGHAGIISQEIDPDLLHALLTVDGGEVVELP